MGSTMFQGYSLQQVLQLKSMNKLPKPQGLELITKLYNVTTSIIDTRIYNEYKIYKKIQWFQERYANYTLGPSMPQVAFTPLGLPSLASTHSST